MNSEYKVEEDGGHTIRGSNYAATQDLFETPPHSNPSQQLSTDKPNAGEGSSELPLISVEANENSTRFGLAGLGPKAVSALEQGPIFLLVCKAPCTPVE
ncbi:hypothetical protein UY3_10434 [Chelonia mydas]|uniref:Uncharacterized protein n=1 Tax=Chelonia mydas TaxID=8469 RepID=M7BWD5_CHEMY|nr:hypothetical protein UY3_10434 [Chelonia mydas]